MTYRNASRPEAETKRPLTDSDWAEVARLYGEAKTDLEIATAVGCASKTIARWRWREELPRNDRSVTNG